MSRSLKHPAEYVCNLMWLAELVGAPVAITDCGWGGPKIGWITVDGIATLELRERAILRLNSPDIHVATVEAMRIVGVCQQYTMRREAVQRGGYD